MTALPDSIRERAGERAIVDEIDRHGCSIALDDTPTPQVVLDLDSDSLPRFGRRKKCDYLFVGGTPPDEWLVLVELKSGTLTVNDTARQLRGGAHLADTVLPDTVAFRLAAVVAHGRPLPPRARRRLQAVEIRLRDRTCRPFLLRCGARLAPLFARDDIAAEEQAEAR